MAKEILIADSDRTSRLEFQKIFGPTAYRLIFSENGEDALIQVRFFKPDLIIASTTLADKNGLELCESLKSDSEFQDIPFILLTAIFDNASEKDRDHVHADGIIARPLQADEIIRLVDNLLKEEPMKKKKETRKEESLLDELEKIGQEDVIELMDVVEEPESKMSINDFLAPVKEEPLADITPLETWTQKPFEDKSTRDKKEEKPPKQENAFEEVNLREEKAFEDEFLLNLEEKMKEKEEEAEPPPKQEEKFSLDLEKEAPREDEGFGKIDLNEIMKEVEDLQLAPKETKAAEEEFSFSEEPGEKLFSLEEFETALSSGKMEFPEEERPSFSDREPKKEASLDIPPLEIPMEEESLKPEPLEEEDLQLILGQKPMGGQRAEIPALEIPAEEEELGELPEEDFPEELLAEMLREDKKDKILTEAKHMAAGEPMEQKVERKEEKKEPPPLKEAAAPIIHRPEKQIEDLITRGIQTMMEDFVTRVVPAMAQDIMSLTVERIETMVKDIVPEIAERVIRDEIRRLQGEEKD